MARVITTESPSRDACRYLGHWTSEDFVRPRLRAKHSGLPADRVRTKSRQIAVLVQQGIEFLESARDSSTLTKPLALYYSAENFAKAGCIFRDESKDMSDFGHHGLYGVRKKRNFVRNLSCTIGSRRDGVWRQLFALFNADRMRFTVHEEGNTLLRDNVAAYTTKQLPAQTELGLGELLRHLPELTEDVVLADWGHPFVVHAADLDLTKHTGPPEQYTVRMLLRHAHEADTRAMVINRESDLLKSFIRSFDQEDILVYYTTPTTEPISIPNGRLDAFGELYLDFARGIKVFGELILYFASLFILSDVVRYQADQWLRLLDDHRAEAILIERFLDVVVRKLPNLILNELHGELILFKFAR